MILNVDCICSISNTNTANFSYSLRTVKDMFIQRKCLMLVEKCNGLLIIHCDLVLYRQRSLFWFSVNIINAVSVAFPEHSYRNLVCHMLCQHIEQYYWLKESLISYCSMSYSQKYEGIQYCMLNMVLVMDHF